MCIWVDLEIVSLHVLLVSVSHVHTRLIARGSLLALHAIVFKVFCSACGDVAVFFLHTTESMDEDTAPSKAAAKQAGKAKGKIVAPSAQAAAANGVNGGKQEPGVQGTGKKQKSRGPKEKGPRNAAAAGAANGATKPAEGKSR